MAALCWTFLSRRSAGRILACASSTSCAVPFIPPVICLAAFPCIESSSLVTPTRPSDFWECAILNGGMYHTSAAYVRAGIATVLNSSLVLLGERPPVDLVMRVSCWFQRIALAVVFAIWAFQVSLGSKITPRFLYVCTLVMVVIGLVLVWLWVVIVRGGETVLVLGRGKSMTASLDSSNCELWL